MIAFGLIPRHADDRPHPPDAPLTPCVMRVAADTRHVSDTLFHFARQFKTATGHPPHDYLIRLRVDRAQELIRQRGREWTLAAIAHECGFADQSHMARHFKRVLGVSPGEFADAHL